VRKILASILAITMLLTTMSACVIPAQAEDAVAVATDNYVFNETFEDYGTGNWLAGLDENGYVTGIDEMTAQSWTVYGDGHTTTVEDVTTPNASVEVAEYPADSGNKALKVNTGTMATNSWFRLRRNAVDSNDGMKRSDLTGKVLVIKADFYVPTGYTTAGDTGVFGYDPYKTGASRYFRGIGRTGGNTSWYLQGVGGANYAAATHGRVQYAKFGTDDITTLKFIHNFDGYREAGHEADTLRAFANDQIQTAGLGAETGSETAFAKQTIVNSKFPQPAASYADLAADGRSAGKVIDGWGGYNFFTSADGYLDFGDFYGASLTISQGSATEQVMYIDNIVAYYIDPFVQDGEITYGETDENGNWYKGGIEIPFNNAIRTSVKEHYKARLIEEEKTYALTDLVKVIETETGEALADVNVTTANEGKTLVVTPPKGLEAGKEYKIVADALFMDEEGQGLNIYSKETELTSFTVGVDPYAHIIYDIDFDSYDIDGENWIENLDGNYYVTSSGVESGAITVLHATAASDAHNITVVKDPADETNGNKVLALKAGYEGAGNVTHIRFNANGKTGISRADMGKGKKLVYKTKIFLPTKFSMTESSQLVNLNKQIQAAANSVSGIGTTMSSYIYVAATGTWNYPMARSQTVQDPSNAGNGTHTTWGRWVELKHVADVSKPLSATHSDTVRAYFDDRLVTSVVGNTGAGNSHGTNAKYTTTKSGDTIIDYLPAKVLFNGVDYESIGNTWWGSAFTINPQADTTKNDTFYIDDVEAFWIDALTFDAINAENFEGGKVKINFNQKIRETVEYYGNAPHKNFVYSGNVVTLGLDDLFTIVDPETKEEIPNGVASVTLSEDGKTVSITPSADLVKGGDYQIKLSEYLVDEYGQGLENNSTATYIDLHISETFTPFALESISQDSVSGFVTGRDVKVTAKFSVAVDDESITNGIVVTNTDTDTVIARNNGWTANFGTDEDGNVDYKTVVFDFGSLPTANYEVTADEDFLATNGASLASAFEFAITAATQPIELFNETFDADGDTQYTVGENWINSNNEVTDGTLTNNTNYKSYTVGNHDWDIQTHWSTGYDEAAANEFVGIVNATDKMSGTNMTGNVLKLYSNRGSGYSKDYVAFRRNFNKLNGIDFSSEAYKGKKLVYEADIYADSVAGDNSFFVPFAASSTKTIRDYNDWKMTFNSAGLRSPGHYDSSLASSGAMAMFAQVMTNSIATITKAPVKYKMVVSMGENVDTLAYYVNGQLVQRPASAQAVLKGHEYNNSARHEFAPSDGTYGETLEINDVIYGIWGLVGQGASTARTVYLDNFKAYLVDEFNVESVTGAGNVFNTAKANVTYTFSKPVDEASAVANSTVVLLDEEGNAVAGGIEKVTLDDANYKLVVKLAETLPGKTNYTIKLTEELKDVDGLALSTKWKSYEYPIDQFYTGTDNVYSVTNVAGTATIDMYYTPAANGKPAYLSTSAAGANKAAVDTYVRDAEAMKMVVSLTTSKATSLFAEAGTATVNGADVATSVVFTNPETDARNVWCVVAAFGDYNEMLGCVAIEREVAAGSSTESIPVNFTASKEGITAVKMFVWNNYDDMVPYHKAESIY